MRPHTPVTVASALRPQLLLLPLNLLPVKRGSRDTHARDTDHKNCLTRIPHNQPDPQTQQLP